MNRHYKMTPNVQGLPPRLRALLRGSPAEGI